VFIDKELLPRGPCDIISFGGLPRKIVTVIREQVTDIVLKQLRIDRGQELPISVP
jgi:hypothetical protein